MANEFQEKITKVKTAMDNRYENKQSNKKTDISGSFTNDTDSYPTVQAVKTYVEGKGYLVSSDISGKENSNNKVSSWSSTTNDTRYPSEKLVKDSLDNKENSSNKVTSWTSTTTDTHYPSEKLVKDSLDGKISKSQTSGLMKNDGTVDTTTYASASSVPTKTSDLTNDADGTTGATYILSTDSRLTDSRTPTSHTHGNLTNAGAIGNASGKIITTTTDGVLQASSSITKSMISDFPTEMTPSSHTHGDITDGGKLGSTANLPLITSTGGKIATGSFGNSANTFCEGNDSRLSDARTPTSHTHGNITNDGTVGSAANKPLITTTDGAVTTGSFGTTANTFAEGNHTHSQYLTSHQSLSDIGGTVTVEKQTTAETGYIATYVIKQGGTALSPKINIPKDYLVKSASMGTVSTANSPVSGYAVGDKYLDFVINTRDNSGTDEHIYINVKDLIDTYTAGSGLTLSNNQFSISNGDISLSMLATGVQTSLGYADTFHSSPAAGITSTQVSNWDSMASGGMTQSNVDARINQALDDLAELIYPTSS